MSKVNKSENIRIERVWSMPNKNTFEIKPIKELIEEEVCLDNIWIDPFANRNKIASITNDLSLEYDTDYHLDALEFLRLFEDESVDGVLYDPPYSPRQVSECYNNVGYNVTWDTTKASFWGNHKREISRIVKKGGKVITFGWNSGGIGYKYGFEISRILLVPHGGWHNDTICTVEIKTHDGLVTSDIIIDESKRKQEVSMKTKTDIELISKLNKLPMDYWDFREEDTKEYTHGIHNYPAMMVSPISRNIIAMMKELMPINSLLDPFAGSGTVLVEGMLADVKEIAGTDINPLALFLTKAKTTVLDCSSLNCEILSLKERLESQYNKYETVLSEVDNYIIDNLKLNITAKDGWGTDAADYLSTYCSLNNCNIVIPNFKNMGYWFRPRVILELSLIKGEINKIKDEAIRNYISVAFSESIRLVSNRRNGEFKMFRMPAAKVLKHNPDVLEEFNKLLERNYQKMEAFAERMRENHNFENVSVQKNNACTLEDIQDEYYDLIITSPPYGDSKTTVAYGEYSRLSLQWLDLFEMTEKEIMGVDKTLMGGKKYRNGFELSLGSTTLRTSLTKIKDIDLERAGDVYSFYEDLNEVIKSVSKKTRVGGYQFWVVGNRTVKGELLQTDMIISELASEFGMETIYTINRNIPNKVMPSLNSPTNESGVKVTTMTMEHIVILKRIK